MRVTNINGTSDTTCKCGSWLQHWVNYNTGGQNLPVYCSEKSCINNDLLGAHVQKANSTDDKWYIVPLCTSHNRATGQLELVESITLAPANKKETCEKSLTSIW